MTKRSNAVTIRPLSTLALAALLMVGQPASAQLRSASSAMMGTGGNYTALARGFGAVGINPAGLAMPGSPDFSLTFPSIRGRTGLNPISFSDLKDYEDTLIPASVKEGWLQDIAGEGSQTGFGGAEVTSMGLSIGRIGLQLSSVALVQTDLNEDAAELLLFGNGGRTGVPRDLNLAGSSMEGFAVSTLGVGFAFPLNFRPMGYDDEAFAIGATLKYSLGHFLMLARDMGSLLQSDPIALDVTFPVAHTATEDYGVDGGSGFGMDLGVMWEGGGWAMGASVQNVFNTFEWSPDALVYRPGEAFFDGSDEDGTDFDEQPFSNAPSSMQSEVEKMTFDPLISLGMAYEASDIVTLTADVRHQLGEGIILSPETHAGAGVELHPVGPIFLRGGGAWVTDGYRFGGGAGLALGPVHLSGAALWQGGDAGEATYAMLTLSFGGY